MDKEKQYLPINLTELFYVVRDRHDEIEFSFPIRNMSSLYNLMCSINGGSDMPNHLFQVILIVLIGADKNISDDEYNIYLKLTDLIEVKPIAKEAMETLLTRPIIEKSINESIGILVNLRNVIDKYSFDNNETIYEDFIFALCIIATYDDGKINEKEYNLITCFLDDDVDTYLPFNEFVETLMKDE